MIDLDILVAGGGPAGATTALALARRGHRVLLAERTAYDAWRPGEVLPAETRDTLARLGLQPDLCTATLPSSAVLSAWGTSELAERPRDGWHIDRRSFDAELARAAEQAGVTLLRRTRVSRASREADGFRVSLTAPDRRYDVCVRHIVDATGRTGSVVTALGAHRVVYDRLVAIVGCVPPASDDQPAALLVESAADGWWYSAQLPDGRVLAAYMTDGDLLHGKGPPARLWASCLAHTRHTRQRVADPAPDITVEVRNATTSRLVPRVGAGWLAIGDCAESHDPLAARGIQHALLSGNAAAHALDKSLRGQPDALVQLARHDHRSFETYLTARQQHYDRERRWPESLFWRRRQPQAATHPLLHLDPQLCLAVTAAELSPTHRATLEALLPPSDVERLWRICAHPITAHHVVARLLDHRRMDTPADRTILALQHLLIAGALQIVEPELAG